MEIQGKRSRENGQKAEQDKTERATGLGIRTREEIEKWDHIDSPEIPNRGEGTSEIPDLPSGEHDVDRRRWRRHWA